jgi:hypothetical protein
MKNTKLALKATLKTVLALGLLSVLSACPKNNNQAQPVQNVFTNCANCNGVINGAEFLTTDSTEYNGVLNLKLGFSGVVNPNNTYLYNPSNYQGIIAATSGQLNIVQPISQPTCFVPAGNYSVMTLIAGQYSAGIIQGLKIAANGPVSLVINMNTSQIASPNNRDQYNQLLPQQKLFSQDTVIESINGQPCQLRIILNQ